MMKPNRQARPQSVEEIRDFLRKPFLEETQEEDPSYDEEVTVVGKSPEPQEKKLKIQ